jgi:hypothetical protein
MKHTREMRGTGLPLVELEQYCDVCGAPGTVGRAVRFEDDGSVLDLVRLCEACWPEHSVRLAARWNEEHRLHHDAWLRSRWPHAAPGTQPMPEPRSRTVVFESATWHTALQVVTDSLQMHRDRVREGDHSMHAHLCALARSIANDAPFRVGTMPFAVECFLLEYAGPR